MNNENNSFSFSYSGATTDEFKELKEKYTPKRTNKKIKKVHFLDKKVDFYSTMISIVLGIIGICLIAIGIISKINGCFSSMHIAAVIAGILIISTTPFLHFKIQNSIKAYYAPQILALIKEIEQNQI